MIGEPDRPEPDLLKEFADFLDEFADANLEASGVPEDERDLWRQLR
jgi:hypothetical protein